MSPCYFPRKQNPSKGSTFEGKNLPRDKFVRIAKRGNNENDRIASPESVPFIIICSQIMIYFLRYFQHDFPNCAGDNNMIFKDMLKFTQNRSIHK